MFSILKYISKLSIVKETETHYTCLCPVCGDDNFKIKRTGKYRGAYKCWSNFCTSSLIKEKLGVKKLPDSPSFTSPPRIRALPVPFTGVNFVEVPDSFTPLSQKLSSYIGNYHILETIYPYSNTQRVLRIDNPKSNTKYIYIQYRQEDFSWACGAGPDSWPVYLRGLEISILDSTKDTIFFVEGEKTAEFCKSRGLATLTLMSAGYYQQLSATLMLFKLKYPHIKNFIYIPDHDSPGYKKANSFQQCAWRNGLACKILKLSEIPNLNLFEGMDLADFSDMQFEEFKNVIRRNTSNSRSIPGRPEGIYEYTP